MSNGKFTFGLEERIDNAGKPYLFAGIQMLNIVVFVRKDAEKHWTAEIKPFEPPSQRNQKGAADHDD